MSAYWSAPTANKILFARRVGLAEIPVRNRGNVVRDRPSPVDFN